jgi:hypothetical protein
MSRIAEVDSTLISTISNVSSEKGGGRRDREGDGGKELNPTTLSA